MGLSTGAGIARGASAFVNSFLAVRQQKFQQTMMKHQPIIDILMERIKDENTNYYQKGQAADGIQSLIGADGDKRLSEILGVDKAHQKQFNDSLVTNPNKADATASSTQTDSAVTGQVSSAGNPNVNTGTNPLTGEDAGLSTSSPEADTITTKGTAGELIRRGDLTPAQIKLGLIRQQNKAINEDDIDKQTRILTANYTLQKNILGKGGYNKEIFRGRDNDGNYMITMTNGEDERTINLGKVSSEALDKANIAANKPTGRFGQLQQAQEVIAKHDADPHSVLDSDYKAAKMLSDDFEKTGVLKDLQGQVLTQTITGKKPVQESQKPDDNRADQNVRISAQKDFDEAQANEQAFLSTRETLAKQKADAATASSTAKNNFDKIAQEFGPNDKEYTDAEKDYNTKLAAYHKLEADYTLAHQKYIHSNVLKAKAQQRLNSLVPLGSSVTPRRILNSQQKATIDAIRKKNPTQTQTMTDDDIINSITTKP